MPQPHVRTHVGSVPVWPRLIGVKSRIICAWCDTRSASSACYFSHSYRVDASAEKKRSSIHRTIVPSRRSGAVLPSRSASRAAYFIYIFDAAVGFRARMHLATAIISFSVTVGWARRIDKRYAQTFVRVRRCLHMRSLTPIFSPTATTSKAEENVKMLLRVILLLLQCCYQK